MLVLGSSLLLLCLAVVALIAGLRVRAIGDAPSCGECGFDLRGRTPMPEVCGECGTRLDEPGAVQRGVRRRRPAWIAVAAALLLAAAAIGVVAVPGNARQTWLGIAPTWWLRVELAVGGPTLEGPVLAELCRRITAGDVTDDTIAALARGSLDRQATLAATAATDATPFAGWQLERGAIIAEAVASGLLTAEEEIAFARHAFVLSGEGHLTNEASLLLPCVNIHRYRMVPGGNNLMTLRGKPPPMWSFEIETGPVRVGDQVLSRGGASSTSTTDLRNKSRGTMGPRLANVDLPPGRHEGTIDATLTVNRVARTQTYPFTATVLGKGVKTDWDALVAAARAAVGTPSMTLREIGSADGSPSTWEVEVRLEAIERLMGFSSVGQPQLHIGDDWQRARTWASSGHPDDLPVYSATWVLDTRPDGETMSVKFPLSTVTLPDEGLGGRTGKVGLDGRALVYDDVPLTDVAEKR